MVKKIALGVLIALALGSLLVVGQIFAVTWIYDSKMNSVLNKAEHKVPGLELSYESKDKSFTRRQGRLYYNYKLKPGNKLNADHISGAVDVIVNVGPLRVNGEITSVPDVGNLNSILSSFNVEPISFQGEFNARALTPHLEAAVKTSSFLFPTSTGLCKVGQNVAHIEATSQDEVDIALKSAGLICEGAMRYADRPNYRLDLTGVTLRFLPRIIDKKPHFDSLHLDLDQLDFKFSTIYALGFTPEDQVKDPTLQEAISFKDIKSMIALTDPDKKGMSRISFKNTGTYGFAFPYIEHNEIQPFYNVENFHIDGSLDRISLAKLYDASKKVTASAGEQFSTKELLKEVLQGFSDELKMVITTFGFSHDGQSFELTGNSTVAFDLTGSKPKVATMETEASFSIGQKLLEEIAGESYGKILATAIEAGQLRRNGSNFESTFTLKDKVAALNGIPLQNLGDDEDDEELYAEEQRLLQQEREQRRREDAALKAEIEAAKEAQRNLPSMREGNLGGHSAE